MAAANRPVIQGGWRNATLESAVVTSVHDLGDRRVLPLIQRSWRIARSPDAVALTTRWDCARCTGSDYSELAKLARPSRASTRRIGERSAWLKPAVAQPVMLVAAGSTTTVGCAIIQRGHLAQSEGAVARSRFAVGAGCITSVGNEAAQRPEASPQISRQLRHGWSSPGLRRPLYRGQLVHACRTTDAPPRQDRSCSRLRFPHESRHEDDDVAAKQGL